MDERLRQLLARAREHLELRQHEAAEQALRDALGITATHAEVFSLLAFVARAKGDRTAALTFFERAAELEPANTEALLNLAATYRDPGDLDAASRVYGGLRGAREAEPAVLAPAVRGEIAGMHGALARAYADAGCRQEAISELEKAIGLCPSLTELQTELGTLYRDEGNATLARLHYEAACAANPRYVPARVLLGVTLFSMGAIEAAVAEWREALALEPENRSAKMYLRMIEAQRSIPPPRPSVPPVPEEPLR